ncbi:MAG: cyanophycin synthetase [Candidatus Delongbacteria bacterium]
MEEQADTPLPADFDPAYLSTVDELYHDEWALHKLLRIRWLVDSIQSFWPQGHPARLIHVAGTNGKGSTCRLLEAGLALVGPAGAMTNPHLFDFAERCSLNGVPLPHSTWSRLWRERIRPHSLDRAERGLERGLSFAEAGILLSLQAFAEAGARWGILETGVGGRYAPSMALTPALCVLTNVGNDHPRTLGHAVWQRALEKAGIARPGVPLLTGARGQALEVIRRVAEQEGAPLHVVDEAAVTGLRLRAATLCDTTGLPEHAWRNLALALATLERAEPGLEPNELLRTLLAVPPLPGRFWQPRPHLVADVAHNPDKLAALAAQLAEVFPGRPLVLVFGVSRERALAPMLAPLADRTAHVVLTGASYAGRAPGALADECRAAFPNLPLQVEPDPVRALALAEAGRRDDELVVLTGSAYSIDQALNPDPCLRRLNAEYGRRGRAGGPANH